LSVADAFAARGVGEVVHFTTSHGCLGALYARAVLSRARLQNDETVRYLFSANAKFRKDSAYLDYISLSLEHVNAEFYRTCAGSWHKHESIFWCVLAFDPVVLTHDGVVFATTNNIYSSVMRGTGDVGLGRLYADKVVRWATTPVVKRSAETRPAYPTCPQAEALYPGSLSTEYLRRIYVQTTAAQSEVVGFLKATFHSDVDVIVAPDKFEDRPA